MTFEDDLRSSLHAEVRDLDLHGRGATEVMHRARRRQHRARRAGAVAAVGVLGVGAVGAIAVRGRDADGVAVTSVASDLGLPDVGPLELSWQATAGGITGGTRGEAIFTEDAAGGIYALSTAPGSRFDPVTGAPPPAALYRLGPDGTWIPVSGGATPPPLGDLTADGTVLYALSTSPATSGTGYDAVLSSSTDGGTTWTTASVAPVTPPSAAVPWDGGSTLSIESVPGASVAVVTTSFFPNHSVLTQAAAAAGYTERDTNGLSAEYTDAGLAVVTYDNATTTGTGQAVEIDPQAQKAEAEREAAGLPGTTVAPEPASSDAAPPSTKVSGRPTATVVATIPWAQLGITGAADLTAHAQVLLHEGGAWVPVESPALQGLSLNDLRVVGQELVVTGWVDDRSASASGGSTRTLASTDGRTWREVPGSADSRLVGLGSAWVDLPYPNGNQQSVVRSSMDQGASWQSVDLGSIDGRLADTSVISVDSGSLGLAFVAMGPWSEGAPLEQYLVTTRDLATWTVTPVSDITGIPNSSGASVFVGTDRIVVTSTAEAGSSSEAPASATAIGTPVR